MNDKFIKGIGSGVTAGVVAAVWNLATYYFNFSTLRYLDFSGVLIYGRKPTGTLESIFAWFGMLMFQALLGIVYAYLSPVIKTRHYLLKGWFYGVMVWFGSYAVTILFNVPELKIVSFKTAASNFIGASIFGWVLAHTLQLLDRVKT